MSANRSPTTHDHHVFLKRPRPSDATPEETRSAGPKQLRFTYPRRRAATACSACRERKKKCDNERPTCGFCSSSGATCVYPGKETSTFDPASLCILDRLADIESSLSNLNHLVVKQSQSAYSGTKSNPKAYVPPETPGVSSPTTPTSKGFPPSSRVTTDAVLAWPFFRSALSQVPKWTLLDYRGEPFSSHLRVAPPTNTNQTSIKSQQRLGFSYLSIDWDNLQPFLDRYFRGVNVKNPVLDRPDIQLIYEGIRENGPAWEPSTCLILVVCALGALAPDWTYHELETTEIGLHDSPPSSYISKDLRISTQFYRAAQDLLGVALITSDLRSLQCLCLAAVYQMYRLDCVTAVRMFHVAGNAVQTFLSTTEMNIASNFLESGEMDSVQRLLWTCTKSERELLADIPIGTLAITHSRQFERYPQPPQTPTFGNTEDDWQSVEEDSWYYYLAEIALRRIADDIVSMLYPAEAEQDYFDPDYPINDLIPITQEFARQLESWHQSLPAQVSFPQSPEKVSSEVKFFSRTRYYLMMELLHRPYICYAIHNSDIDIDSEVLALASHGLCFARDYLLASNHGHVHHGKWLQFRRELTAGCLLLGASQCNIKMPSEWYQGVERARQNFQKWMPDLPSLASFMQVLDAIDSSDDEDSSDVHNGPGIA